MISHIFQVEEHKNIENYAFNFIKFLKENLSENEFSEHRFYFSYFENENLKDSLLKRLNEIAFPISQIKYFSNHFKLMNDLKFSNYENNIFHQLSSKKIYLYLFLNTSLNKKSSWVIWGGDLYQVFISKLSYKYKLYDFIIRTKVIKNLKYIMSMKGDFDLLKTRYTTNAKHFFTLYSMPSKIYKIEEFKNSSSKAKRILVAHSANKANNHEKIFKMLLPYKNENLEILVPLSYGDLSNVKAVEELGIKLFGNKFIPIKDFMKPDEFSTFLETIDIAIFAVDRQAAVGILTTLISLGKKVFYKKGVVPFDFYEKNHIRVFDTDEIINQKFEQFLEMSEEDKLNNIKHINNIYNNENLIQMWRSVFDSKID